jgi:hypothetical protein
MAPLPQSGPIPNNQRLPGPADWHKCHALVAVRCSRATYLLVGYLAAAGHSQHLVTNTKLVHPGGVAILKQNLGVAREAVFAAIDNLGHTEGVCSAIRDFMWTGKQIKVPRDCGHRF